MHTHIVGVRVRETIKIQIHDISFFFFLLFINDIIYTLFTTNIIPIYLFLHANYEKHILGNSEKTMHMEYI